MRAALLAGSACWTAYWPLPASVRPVYGLPYTVTGVLPPLAVIATNSLSPPAACGLNSYCRLQLAPAARDVPQLLVEVMKLDVLPVGAATAIVTVLGVELVSTAPNTADVVPTVWLPKLCLAVDSVTPAEAVPVPDSVPPLDGENVALAGWPVRYHVAE